MRLKIREIKLFKQILSVESIKRGRPLYITDPDFLKVAKIHAEILNARYNEMPHKQWKEQRDKNALIGMEGQIAASLLLQRLGVPHIMNDIIVPYKEQKPYDCFIPTFGTVEIKTEPSGERIRNCIVKAREWHRNNFLMTWQASDEALAFLGWLTGQEVEKVGITGEGESPQTWAAAAYVIPLKSLRSPKTFLEMLPINQDGCSNVELLK
jgi:hypothetical protein